MEPPRTISVSQVTAYLACPLKYRFQYADKIPRPWKDAAMAFGSGAGAEFPRAIPAGHNVFAYLVQGAASFGPDRQADRVGRQEYEGDQPPGGQPVR